GIARARPLERRRMRGMPDHAAHIVALIDPPDLARVGVDDGDVDALGGEMSRNGRADLPRPADYHFHSRPPERQRIARTVHLPPIAARNAPGTRLSCGG